MPKRFWNSSAFEYDLLYLAVKFLNNSSAKRGGIWIRNTPTCNGIATKHNATNITNIQQPFVHFIFFFVFCACVFFFFCEFFTLLDRTEWNPYVRWNLLAECMNSELTIINNHIQLIYLRRKYKKCQEHEKSANNLK